LFLTEDEAKDLMLDAETREWLGGWAAPELKPPEQTTD
jgi:hypothetical protein